MNLGRLVSAEVLKLIRRRGLMIWSALLTVGAVLVAEVIVLVLHAVNPDRHGSAGGRTNLENYVFLVSGLGNVAAIILGSTAGTQDVSNGVFRDLAVTGRRRSTLFNVRVPGALAVFLPLITAALAVAVAGSFLFAGDKPLPTWSTVGHFAAYTYALTVVDLVLAVGLAAFVSSRIVVGVLIAWNAIVSHLLIQISALGGARKLIDVAAAEHFAPAINGNTRVAMSGVTAALVLLAWAAIAMRAGRWWTTRRDA